jgi:hypothetical protein
VGSGRLPDEQLTSFLIDSYPIDNSSTDTDAPIDTHDVWTPLVSAAAADEML